MVANLNIIIVAHPDDESLFFSSIPLFHVNSICWIICVTDANADGRGEKRKQQFKKACELLNINRTFWLGFPDIFEKRLDVIKLGNDLSNIFIKYQEQITSHSVQIFCHGPLGEYMHPHHQDVCYAVTKYFSKSYPVFFPSYNCYPDNKIELDRVAFNKKKKILSDIYGTETSRFLHLIPATWVEGFTKISFREVEEIYNYLSYKNKMN